MFSGLRMSDCSHPCNSLPTRGDFCHLLITFANSLDPDQARQNVGPDLDPNCYNLMVLKKNPAFKELNMAQYNKV